MPSRDFPRPQEGEIICVVKKMLGAEHIIIACLDGKERTARIPGRMRKKTWIKEGDVILAAPWDFQPNKADVVYKYMNDEIKKLIEEKVISRDVIDQLRG